MPDPIQTLLAALLAAFLGPPAEPLPAPTAQAAEPSADFPPVLDVPAQPFAAGVRRVVESLELLGTPLAPKTAAALASALGRASDAELVHGVQAALDPLCLFQVDINPEARVKVQGGPAPATLVEQGWTHFLVKVSNRAGVTAALAVESPNRGPWPNQPLAEIRERWLEAEVYRGPLLAPELSGLRAEYRVLSLFAAGAGTFEARLSFDVGQGTQDLGFRSDANVLFEVLPACRVDLLLRDEDGSETTARLTVRDERGRIYPAMQKRLGADFFFQPQVYRHSGESLRLPQGSYLVECSRGPEYRTQSLRLEVPAAESMRLELDLERWIDPAARGWVSSDHHIHAAGCKHYREPTEGVHPDAVARHLRGEGLDVGAVLIWGLGFEYQRQFFGGDVHPLSAAGSVLRYDLEIAGFASHKSGHLCLLGMSEVDYPGSGGDIEAWPSWCLPILRWARSQGAVTGSGHSGNGLGNAVTAIPDYGIPPMNGIGAMELFVDVTHGAVDFMGLGNSGYLRELNAWYHLQNCGYDLTISGGTDFPCLTGDRIGKVRSYVAAERLGEPAEDYASWLDGVRRGAVYVSDGLAHLLDFRVEGVPLGAGPVELEAPGSVRVQCTAAALLPPEAPAVAPSKVFWDVEHARLPGRRVPVEIVVNGRPVWLQEIVADGREVEIDARVPIERSSWVAARMLGACHTNAIQCRVDAAPVRASRGSAFWCLQAVEQAWEQKHPLIEDRDREDARLAYDHARDTYLGIAAECEPEAVPGWPRLDSPFGFDAFPARLEEIRERAQTDVGAALGLADELERALDAKLADGTLSEMASGILLRDLARARREVAGEHFLRVPSWWMLGPFPGSPLTEPLPPEEAPFDPSRSFSGLAGRVAWAERDYLGVTFATALRSAAQPITYYIATEIESPASCWTEMSMGIDGKLFHPANMIRLWVNGELAYEKDTVRSLSLQRDRFNVRLQEGRNVILARVLVRSPRSRLALGIRSPEELRCAVE